MRLLSTLVSLFILLPFCASCSIPLIGSGVPGDPAASKRHVTLVARMEQMDYWKTVRMGAEAAAKEFNIVLDVVSPKDEDDVQGQIDLINKAVAGKQTDVLVVAANDYLKLSSAVEHAIDSGIPVINIDSEVNSPKVASFIGIDNIEAGRQAGKRLVELIGQRGQVAVVSFGTGAKNGEQRREGVLEVLRGYPDIDVVTAEHCTSEGISCAELTRRLLARYGTIQGIVALDGVSSVGAAGEIRRLGYGGKVKVVTFDTTQEEAELLQEGVIQATTVQNPFSMGYFGVKYAVEVLSGREVPRRLDAETKVIDRNNMFWLENQQLLFPFVQ